MNFRNLFSISLLIAVFSLFSCNKDTVKVNSFSPQGEVKPLQSFSVEFSHDLAPPDKLNEWTTEPYIEFDPPIEGRFKWVLANTLIFSPDQPLEASQDYKAKINPKEVLFGERKGTQFEKYEFSTPHFDLAKVDFFWKQIPHSSHKLSVQANIAFNYPVEPTEFGKYVEVSQGGKKMTDYQVVSDAAADVMAVNFGEIQQTQEAQNFKITIKKGLNSVLNKKALKEDRVFEKELPSITRLSITSVSSGFGDNSGWIEVRTSQEVDKDQLQKFVVLNPKPAQLKFEVSEDRFRIEGKMAAGTNMVLKLKKNLPGLYGGTLDDEYTENIVLADLEPRLRFAEKYGTYLMRSGMQNLNIEATNVKKANISVYEVFKNNLLFFFYNNYSYSNQFYSNYRQYDDAQRYDIDYYGKRLYEKDIEFEDVRNSRESFTMNMGEALNQRFKGIYVVQVRSEEDYWMSDAKIVAISDLGIIARQSETELLVLVNSLKSADPVEGVKIDLISATNQTLVSGTTDANGIARFSDLKADVDDFQARMIIAEKGDDFNFIDLRATQVETSRHDVGGKHIADDQYDAFIYSDRNIYRPGETAHLSAIFRTADLETVTNVPISVKIITPQGKTLEEYQKTLNTEGSFDLGVNLPDYARTGQYVMELYSGSDKFISSYRFSVEEFVPDKIRVNLDTDQKIATAGKPLQIEVNSEYLFGAPAAGHKYEMDVSLRHQSFNSKKYPKFHFWDYSVKNSYLDNDFREGSLDEEGKAAIEYNFPSQVKSGGFINGTARVSVFDVTGRTVTQAVNFKSYPNEEFIGIKSPGYYYGTQKDITFDLVAVGPEDGDIKRLDVEIELVRYEWKTVLERSNYSGRYQYRSVKKEVSEWRKPFSLSSTPKGFTFRADKSGSHEIRIYKKGQNDYVKKYFYAYRWGNTTASSFEIDKEGQVEIVLDKEEYRPGESAKALFVTPFRGKMLVTVERDKVMDHFYVDMDENSKEVSIPLSGEHVPNVYITATLFRPHNADDNIPFLVGHGYAAVKVANPSNKLNITIDMPAERVKPRSRQYITVKADAGKDVFVTLAAVDEGILQVKNFKTPDPHAHMYAKRRLSVSGYDLYQYLLPEIVTSSSSPAGGDESARRKQLNPVKSDRFKLLSQWSGIKRTNSNGEVKIPIDIPQYNGEVRLMAVAYQGKRFGSAEKALKVSDDVILMPSVPRFLTINDSLRIPVSVMNTTKAKGNVQVEMSVEGPLKVTSKKSASLSIDGGGTGQAVFVLEADSKVGVGKITFTSSGLDKVTEEIEISVSPNAPKISENNWGSIKAGETKAIKLPQNFIAGTQSTSLTVSSFPTLQFANHIRYLVGYPHGCLEQTTSKLFPQLYFNELAQIAAPDLYKRGNPVYYVKEGIKKLEGMQRYDGSFNYWSGGNYYNWWGSVYATHFLIEAKNAGFSVDQAVIDKALTFLAKRAVSKSTYQYTTYKNGAQTLNTIANKEIIYSLYVLSMAGKADVSTMNYYRARPNLLSSDGLYLLAGAYALDKNYNAYNEIIPKVYEPEVCARTSGGSFDSEARANAIMLNVLLDVDPSNNRIPQLVKHLSKLGNKIWSTQDRSWAFLALGKAASKQKSSNVEVEVLVDGKSIKTLTGKHGNIPASQISGKEITLKAKGEGETYYFWNSEGVPLGGVKSVDEGIAVRRKYFSRFGNEITSFTQGDLIVCEITLTGGPQSVENLVIADLIPSGFEIENPRVSTSADLAWVNQAKNKLRPAYMDVRDDRLLLFTDLRSQQTVKYYYMLRAINAGSFQLPAISVEAMYDPDYKSYFGEGMVRISPR